MTTLTPLLDVYSELPAEECKEKSIAFCKNIIVMNNLHIYDLKKEIKRHSNVNAPSYKYELLEYSYKQVADNRLHIYYLESENDKYMKLLQKYSTLTTNK